MFAFVVFVFIFSTKPAGWLGRALNYLTCLFFVGPVRASELFCALIYVFISALYKLFVCLLNFLPYILPYLLPCLRIGLFGFQSHTGLIFQFVTRFVYFLAFLSIPILPEYFHSVSRPDVVGGD